MPGLPLIIMTVTPDGPVEGAARSGWELAAVAIGAGAAFAGLVGALWWLIKPRVERWARGQIVTPVAAIREQVTPNGGHSDMLGDRVVNLEVEVGNLEKLMVNHLEDHTESDLRR